MIRIVADSDIPFIKGVLEPYASVTYLSGKSIRRESLSGVDALLVRTRTRCGEELLKETSVKMIATATIGCDHIDLDYCSRAGIEVRAAPGCNARAVLQWFAAAMDSFMAPALLPSGLKLGVVGVGNVGSLIASYGRMWGFDVMVCDPPLKQRLQSMGCSENDADSRFLSICPATSKDMTLQSAQFYNLETLARECDIISFHTPLTYDGPHKTVHMAGEEFFRILAGRRSVWAHSGILPRPLILNASRGEVIDTCALNAAMERGYCDCIIDTFEHEPDINRSLVGMSLLSTPHIAGYSAQGKANASAMIVEAVSRRFGMPLTGWYPSGVSRVEPRPIKWEEMRHTIKGYFDIESQSHRLKEAPEEFENFRNGYLYRTEYF